jgi:hypothetical protein
MKSCQKTVCDFEPQGYNDGRNKSIKLDKEIRNSIMDILSNRSSSPVISVGNNEREFIRRSSIKMMKSFKTNNNVRVMNQVDPNTESISTSLMSDQPSGSMVYKKSIKRPKNLAVPSPGTPPMLITQPSYTDRAERSLAMGRLDEMEEKLHEALGLIRELKNNQRAMSTITTTCDDEETRVM